MKVNYFDLGLYRGVELGWMVNQILPSLGVDEFGVYGLEASAPYAITWRNCTPKTPMFLSTMLPLLAKKKRFDFIIRLIC